MSQNSSNSKSRPRVAFLKSKGLCFGCVKKGHLSSQCKKKLKCAVCSKLHLTILHNKDQGGGKEQKPSMCAIQNSVSTIQADIPPSERNVCTSSTTNEQQDGNVSCAMAIILVTLKLKNKPHQIVTYAFFDTGSSVSFCTENIMRQLGAQGKKTQITINTMGNSQKLNAYVINGLQVAGIASKQVVDLPNVYTKEFMPVTKEHIPTQDEIQKWPHLASIPIPQIHAEIGIMIGNNVPDAYTPFDLVTGPHGSPHATRTRLGWIPWNVIRSRTTFDANHLCVESPVDDSHLIIALKQIMNFDFPERLIDDKKENSVEDNCFLQQVENSIHLKNYHCSIALPFREQNIVLPNNSTQCQRRLQGLCNRFRKDPKFKEHYKHFMNKIIENNYAELVPEEMMEKCGIYPIMAFTIQRN